MLERQSSRLLETLSAVNQGAHDCRWLHLCFRWPASNLHWGRPNSGARKRGQLFYQRQRPSRIPIEFATASTNDMQFPLSGDVCLTVGYRHKLREVTEV